MDDERLAYLALTQVPGVGIARLEVLLAAFETALGAHSAPFEFLCALPGFSRAFASAVKATPLEAGRLAAESAERVGATATSRPMPRFPPSSVPSPIRRRCSSSSETQRCSIVPPWPWSAAGTTPNTAPGCAGPSPRRPLQRASSWSAAWRGTRRGGPRGGARHRRRYHRRARQWARRGVPGRQPAALRPRCRRGVAARANFPPARSPTPEAFPGATGSSADCRVSPSSSKRPSARERSSPPEPRWSRVARSWRCPVRSPARSRWEPIGSSATGGPLPRTARPAAALRRREATPKDGGVARGAAGIARFAHRRRATPGVPARRRMPARRPARRAGRPAGRHGAGDVVRAGNRGRRGATPGEAVQAIIIDSPDYDARHTTRLAVVLAG